MMMNRSGETGYSYLDPYVKEKITSFLPLIMMLALGVFADVLYQVEKVSSILGLLNVYNMSWY